MKNETTKLDGSLFAKITLDLMIEQNARLLTHNEYIVKILSERNDFSVDDYLCETDFVFQETRNALIQSLFSRY